jgi:hypothetical protein
LSKKNERIVEERIVERSTCFVDSDQKRSDITVRGFQFPLNLL